MLRRSFRIGLRLGLLAGAVFALVKIFRPKPEHSPVLDVGAPAGSMTKTDWPPLQAEVQAETPSSAPVAPEPVAPAPQPEVAPVVQAEAPVQQAPAPAPPKPAPAKKAAKATKKAAPAADRVAVTWVDPEDNICPKSHPVKGKMSSMIFQIPGNFAYDRTNPDRCYESAAAAAADGLRPAKR